MQYTLATESTELATMSTATSCEIQVVADLLPKPATKSAVSATVDFVAGFGNSRPSWIQLCRKCAPGFMQHCGVSTGLSLYDEFISGRCTRAFSTTFTRITPPAIHASTLFCDPVIVIIAHNEIHCAQKISLAESSIHPSIHPFISKMSNVNIMKITQLAMLNAKWNTEQKRKTLC